MSVDTHLDRAEYDTWPPKDETVRCPYPYFEQARRTEPVYVMPVARPDGQPVVLVTSHAASLEVLTKADVYACRIDPETDLPIPLPDEPSFYRPENIFYSNGDDHRAKRRFVNPLLTRQRMDGYRDLVSRVTSDLLDGFAEKGSCDFRAEFTDRMPLIVALRSLGLSDDVIPAIKRLSFAMAALEGNINPSDELRQTLQDAVDELHAHILGALEDKGSEPQDDYISDLIRLQVEKDGALDRNALTVQLEMTVFGADHAVGGYLADLVVSLAQHPEYQQLLRDDPSQIKKFAVETLRIEPAVPWLTRTATQDTELAGVPIPAGSLMVIATASANRDPDVFPEPEDFDIHRPGLERSFMTMGQGSHRCPGQPLALIQAEVLIGQLLERFTNIRLDDERSDLTPELSYQFRVPTAVHILFDRR
jgi:cytochrome P450